MAEPRDGWSKLDAAGKFIAGVFLPLVLFLVGQEYTRQQAEAEKSQRDSDRMALLLNHLGSDRARERLLAVRFIEYFAHADQFPRELLPVVLTAVEDDNSEVAASASQALAQVVSADTGAARVVRQAAERSTSVRQSVIRAGRLAPRLKETINVNSGAGAVQ